MKKKKNKNKNKNKKKKKNDTKTLNTGNVSLVGLLRNSVVTINGRPDMIFTVDHGRKAATQPNNQTQTKHFWEKVLEYLTIYVHDGHLVHMIRVIS